MGVWGKEPLLQKGPFPRIIFEKMQFLIFLLHAAGPRAFGLRVQVVSLDMDSLGVLQIERSGSRVTLCLARPLPQHDDQVCRAALAQCHYRDMGAYPVSAGLRNNDTLVFLVHVPERAFSIPELEHCFDALVRAHDAATAQPG